MTVTNEAQDLANGKRWTELVGPFYSVEDYGAWKSLEPEEVDEVIKARQILTVTTGDGSILIPSRQFNQYGEAPPYICEVLQILGNAGVHSWAAALWLCAETDRYDTKGKISAIASLHSGQHAAVLLAAAHDSNIWMR